MGEGGDRLPLHGVPLVHGAVEEPRRIEDLEAGVADVEVPDENALRRERVRSDPRARGAHPPDERALPHVRISRDDDRRSLRIDVREFLQRAPGLLEAFKVRRYLVDDGGEAPECFPADRSDSSRSMGGLNPAGEPARELEDLLPAPINAGEVLPQGRNADRRLDELAIERRGAVERREALDV